MITYQTLQYPADLIDACHVRTAVFVHEQGFAAEIEFDQIDHDAIHIVLYRDGVPLGTGRTFPDHPGDTTYHIGRVAIMPEARKLGLGRLLMAQLEATAWAAGAQAITLSAQVQAQGFYHQLGYQPAGDTYLEEGVPHLAMKKLHP